MILTNISIFFINNKIFFSLIMFVLGYFLGSVILTYSKYNIFVMKKNIAEAINEYNIEFFNSNYKEIKYDSYNGSILFDNYFNNFNTILFNIIFAFFLFSLVFIFNDIISYFIFVFISFLFCLSIMIDHYTKYLPTDFLLNMLLIGLGLSLINSYYYLSPLIIDLKDSVAGVLLGYFLLLIINFTIKCVTKRNSIGQGDFLLFGAIGSYIGFDSIIYSYLLSCLIFLFYVLIRKINKYKVINNEIPFGPSIFIGCLLCLYLKFIDINLTYFF